MRYAVPRVLHFSAFHLLNGLRPLEYIIPCCDDCVLTSEAVVIWVRPATSADLGTCSLVTSIVALGTVLGFAIDEAVRAIKVVLA